MVVVNCPNCKEPVEWTVAQQFKPFCSERCKLIDLGEWFFEEKRIVGESVEIDNHSKDEFAT
jgi:endogenous inhibitor of DNA gyrase (YacG/DUF329 family)